MPDYIKKLIENPDFIKRFQDTNQNLQNQINQNQTQKTLVNYI